MATRNIPFPDKVRDMVLDVIKHVRRQEYTPEQLCQLQKIIECKYFYWWCMDMKKEEHGHSAVLHGDAGVFGMRAFVVDGGPHQAGQKSRGG